MTDKRWPSCTCHIDAAECEIHRQEPPSEARQEGRESEGRDDDEWLADEPLEDDYDEWLRWVEEEEAR